MGFRVQRIVQVPMRDGVALATDCWVPEGSPVPGLDISSSSFPRYDRDTNTGGVIAEDSASDVITAHDTVLHGPAHPGRLVLPVINR